MGTGVDGRPDREGWEGAGRWTWYSTISRDCDTPVNIALRNGNEYLLEYYVFCSVRHHVCILCCCVATLTAQHIGARPV